MFKTSRLERAGFAARRSVVMARTVWLPPVSLWPQKPV